MLLVATGLHQQTHVNIDDYLLPHVRGWADVGPLALSAIWGVRTYRRGATLEPHVDRLSHALSVIVHVSQEDLSAPWPLQIQDHSGVMHEINLAPGEILLYESARLMHGRSNPLNGRGYSNLFVHYRPAGAVLPRLRLPPAFAESIGERPLFDIGVG